MANGSYEGQDLEVLADIPNYQNWIMAAVAHRIHGDVVELGAGLGSMSRRLRPLADRLVLVEPSENLVAVLDRSFADDGGVAVHGQTLEAFLEATPDAVFDAVVLINVLEHIEDDTAAAQGFMRILKPGGTLFIFVPAMPFLYSALDKAVGHYRRYTKRALTDVLTGAGFKIDDARYFDLLGVAPWWLLNTVLGKTDFNPDMVRIYDRFGVPVTKAFESLIPPPLGKNVYALARKPE